MSVKEKIFAQSPFEGMTVAPDAGLLRAGTFHPVFRAAVAYYRPELIVEVGTCFGDSALHMAGLLRDHGVRGEIVCIDTWLGRPLTWVNHPDPQQRLRLRNGFPQIYYAFLEKVVAAAVDDVITPLPASADDGFAILTRLQALADVIHIDFDHDSAATRRLLRQALDVLSFEGVLICDNALQSVSVTQAVVDLADELDLIAVRQGAKLILSRVDVVARLALTEEGTHTRHPTDA